MTKKKSRNDEELRPHTTCKLYGKYSIQQIHEMLLEQPPNKSTDDCIDALLSKMRDSIVELSKETLTLYLVRLTDVLNKKIKVRSGPLITELISLLRSKTVSEMTEYLGEDDYNDPNLFGQFVPTVLTDLTIAAIHRSCLTHPTFAAAAFALLCPKTSLNRLLSDIECSSKDFQLRDVESLSRIFGEFYNRPVSHYIAANEEQRAAVRSQLRLTSAVVSPVNP